MALFETLTMMLDFTKPLLEVFSLTRYPEQILQVTISLMVQMLIFLSPAETAARAAELSVMFSSNHYLRLVTLNFPLTPYFNVNIYTILLLDVCILLFCFL